MRSSCEGKTLRLREVKWQRQHHPAHVNLGNMGVQKLCSVLTFSFSLFNEAKIQPMDHLSGGASGNFPRRQRHVRICNRRSMVILPVRQILTHIQITLAPANLYKQTIACICVKASFLQTGWYGVNASYSENPEPADGRLPWGGMQHKSWSLILLLLCQCPHLASDAIEST